MIIPVAAERDALGYWTHPSLVRSGCETTAHLTHWLKTHRLACFVMLMCDEGVSLDIENYCTVSLFFEQTYL